MPAVINAAAVEREGRREGPGDRPSWQAWLASRLARQPQHPPRPRIARRVLLISYQYPPTGGSGVQRPAKLARYLPEQGWNVEVLTAAHDRFPWLDLSLCPARAEAVSIHPVAGGEPACLARKAAAAFRPVLCEQRIRWLDDRIYWRLARLCKWLGHGNGESLWVASATAHALRLHRRTPLHAIISTGPPHFAHQVALRIRRAAAIPWVADLRDPLVSDFNRGTSATAGQSNMRRLERAILCHADEIVTTCEALADDFRGRYPQRRPETIRAITNGFDPADLCKAATQQISRVECLFVAAGALYGRREIRRVVEPLQQVLDRRPEWQGRVRLVLAGSIDRQQRQQWENHRPEWLSMAGYLPHAESLALSASAACNIVMAPDCRHTRLSVPGKIFELTALPTHILALAPPGSEAQRIAHRAGAATIVPLENGPGVSSAMERIISEHFAGRLRRDRDWDSLRPYERRSTVARFAECLNAACEGRRE